MCVYVCNQRIKCHTHNHTQPVCMRVCVCAVKDFNLVYQELSEFPMPLPQPPASHPAITEWRVLYCTSIFDYFPAQPSPFKWVELAFLAQTKITRDIFPVWVHILAGIWVPYTVLYIPSHLTPTNFPTVLVVFDILALLRRCMDRAATYSPHLSLPLLSSPTIYFV